jgi:hypothetical protein
MPKNIKRLTRAEKVALTKVPEDFAPAEKIGVSADTLDRLAAYGHVRAVLDCGSMTYRITESGRAFLEGLGARATA